MRHHRLLLTAAILCCLAIVGSAVHAQAPAPTVSAITEPVPTEIAAPVREAIGSSVARVTIGETLVDLWWVKSLPGGGDWAEVPEGTLVGVMRLSAAHRDIRGRTIKPGVYTLRYARQPADGDHMGVSPHRDFLLVSPASVDTDPAPAGHDGAVDRSKATLGTSHPAILSLDPPRAQEPALTVRANSAGHQAVVFEVPGASGAYRFGLILVGRIEA